MAKDAMGKGDPFLPDFCSVKILLFVILTTELVVLAISLTADLPGTDFWMIFGLRSLHGQWLALGSTAILCLFGRYLTAHFAASGQATAVLMVVAGLSLMLSTAAYWLLAPTESLLQYVSRHLAVALIVTGLVLRYLYIQYLHHRQVTAEARSRFQALQARIRPHFLFNSMNTIATLTRSDPQLAESAVEDLADLFRASLSEGDKLATLEEELSLASHYLHIEGLRLGKRLEVEWRVDALPMKTLLPRLTLQPLLENAIYHGIEKRAEGGRIGISGEYREGQVVLRLQNPLPSMAEGFAESRVGHGMALDNVRQRLQAIFGDNASLTVTEESEQYRVDMTFPMQIDEYSDCG